MSAHTSKVKGSSNLKNVEIGGLLETLRPLGGALSENGFALLKTASGEFDILVLDAIGKVLRATRDPDNPNTWMLKETGILAVALASAQDTKTAQDNGVFAIQRDGAGHVFQRLVYDVHRDRLRAVQVSETFFAHPQAKQVIRFQVRRSRESTDTFHLMAGLRNRPARSNGPIYAYQQVSGIQGVSQRGHQPGGWLWWSRESMTKPNQLLEGENVQVIGEFHQGHTGPQLLAIGNVPYFDQENQALHLQKHLEDENEDECGGFGKFLTVTVTGATDLRQVKGGLDFSGNGMMAATNPADGAPTIFKLRRSFHAGEAPFGKISSVTATVGQAGDLLFPKEWEQVPGTTPETEKQNFREIHAIQTSPDAPIDLFLINQTNRLWHMRRNLNGEWSEPVDLGIQATDLTHGFEGSDPQNLNALVVIIGDQNTGALTELHRLDDGWDIQPISLSLGDTIRFAPVRECESTLVMYDKNGAVLPGALVKVRTTDSQDVAAIVNGTPTLLTSKTGFQTMTDGSGTVSIRSRVTGAFGAPTFEIEPDEGSGGPITVNATTDLHAFLSKITKTEVKDARDPATGKAVVNLDKEKSKNVADALHASMSASGQFFPKSVIRKGIAEIAFGDGEVSTRRLKPSDFEALSSKVHSTTEEGFLPTPSWGDLWQAIEEGIYRVEKIVVNTGKSIAEVIVCVGKAVWRYVVTNASQAFDIAWGVLSHVGAKLQAAYNWLLDKFNSFNLWSDIVHNKNWIKAVLKGSTRPLGNEVSKLLSADNLRRLVKDGQSNQANWTDQFESVLKDSGESSNQTVGGLQNNSANWNDMELPKQDGTNLPLAPLHGFQWFIDEALLALTKIDTFTKNVFPKTQDAFVDLLDQLGTDIEKTVEGALDPVKTEFETWLQNPTEFSAKGLANLLGTTASSIVGSVVDTAEDIIVGMAGVGQAIGQDLPGTVTAFDAEISLPYLTDFYRDVLNAGDPDSSNVLSILDLVALILAIPSTIALGRINANADPSVIESNQITRIALATVGILASGVQLILDALFDLARFVSNAVFPSAFGRVWLAGFKNRGEKARDIILAFFFGVSWGFGLIATVFFVALASLDGLLSLAEFNILVASVMASVVTLVLTVAALFKPDIGTSLPLLRVTGLITVTATTIFAAGYMAAAAAKAKGSEKTPLVLMAVAGFLQCLGLTVQMLRGGADWLIKKFPNPYSIGFVITAYIALARFAPFAATALEATALGYLGTDDLEGAQVDRASLA